MEGKNVFLEKWDGKATNRTEIALILGLNLRMISECIKSLEDAGEIDVKNRRLLYPNEVRIILSVYG